MDHCTCEPGRHHDGTERGLCEFCEAEGDREEIATHIAERTEGQWQVGSSLYEGFVACVFVDIGERMTTLAEVRKYKDAVLFSAAPDLLEALRECLEQAEGCWLNHYGVNPEGSAVPQHIASARAAIAKAEGKPFPDLRTGGGR